MKHISCSLSADNSTVSTTYPELINANIVIAIMSGYLQFPPIFNVGNNVYHVEYHSSYSVWTTASYFTCNVTTGLIELINEHAESGGESILTDIYYL